MQGEYSIGLDQLSKPRIVSAANRSEKDGQLVVSARHFDPLMRSQIKAMGRQPHEFAKEQGFIDQHGTYYTRDQALEVAIEQKQIIRRCGGDGLRLFSENLY